MVKNRSCVVLPSDELQIFLHKVKFQVGKRHNHECKNCGQREDGRTDRYPYFMHALLPFLLTQLSLISFETVNF